MSGFSTVLSRTRVLIVMVQQRGQRTRRRGGKTNKTCGCTCPRVEKAGWTAYISLILVLVTAGQSIIWAAERPCEEPLSISSSDLIVGASSRLWTEEESCILIKMVRLGSPPSFSKTIFALSPISLTHLSSLCLTVVPCSRVSLIGIGIVSPHMSQIQVRRVP